MKRTNLALLLIAAIASLPTVQAPAAVKVETAEPVERLVAFRTAANSFITADPSNALDLAGSKIGSKQTFTLVDITGGELADGHEVRIRYTPHTGKPSYWRETKEGIQRGHDGDVFKIRLANARVALVTPTGRFVAPPTVANALGVTDKAESALFVDILDSSTKASILKPTD